MLKRSGLSSGDSSDDVSAPRVTFTAGGTYWVRRLRLGISSSSSDHSASACSNGLGFMVGEWKDAAEESEGSPSAEGQCSFKDLRVESRTSVDTRRVSASSYRAARGGCAPGESVVMSAPVLTSLVCTQKQYGSGEGPWQAHAATGLLNLSSDCRQSAASRGRGARDAIDGRRFGDRESWEKAEQAALSEQ